MFSDSRNFEKTWCIQIVGSQHSRSYCWEPDKWLGLSKPSVAQSLALEPKHFDRFEWVVSWQCLKTKRHHSSCHWKAILMFATLACKDTWHSSIKEMWKMFWGNFVRFVTYRQMSGTGGVVFQAITVNFPIGQSPKFSVSSEARHMGSPERNTKVDWHSMEARFCRSRAHVFFVFGLAKVRRAGNFSGRRGQCG